MEKKEPVFGQSTHAASDIQADTGQMISAEHKDINIGSSNAARDSGLLKILVVILLVAVFAVSGFAWQQSREQKVLQIRFDQLASKISSTDESLSQSGAAMSVRIQEQSEELKKHWSEIRKLWGVSNDRNRKTLEKHKALLAEQAQAVKKLQSGLSKITTTAAGLDKKVQLLKSEGLAANVQVEDVRAEILAASGAVKKLEKQFGGLLEQFAESTRENEKAMASIDSFRRQTNQDLQRLSAQSSQP